jgi:hypothetical protein
MVAELTPRIRGVEPRALTDEATSRRRVLGAAGLALLAWLPLVLLRLAFPRTGPEPEITFVEDLSVHVRFLLVVPLLVLADAVITARTGMTMDAFELSGLIPDAQRARFHDMKARTLRLGNSAVAQAILAGVVTLLIGVAIRSQGSHGLRWFQEQGSGGAHLSIPGWWYVAASVMQVYLFARHFWRYGLWCWLLFRTSRLDLRLVGTHPDRAGGLGFLNIGHAVFSSIPLAASCVLASRVATEVLQVGTPLESFQLPLLSFVVLSLAVGLLPFPIFVRTLARTKRRGLVQYGKLATRYVQDFEQKWLEGGATADERLLGTGDIQSLADIGGSFERLATMKVTPIDRRTLIAFVLASVLPLLPLALTIMPLDEIVKVLLRAVV